MEWLQREHKLAYHFENTANALEEEMKRVQRQYSPVRALENFHFSESAFFLQEFRTAFEPLSKCSTE